MLVCLFLVTFLSFKFDLNVFTFWYSINYLEKTNWEVPPWPNWKNCIYCGIFDCRNTLGNIHTTRDNYKDTLPFVLKRPLWRYSQVWSPTTLKTSRSNASLSFIVLFVWQIITTLSSKHQIYFFPFCIWNATKCCWN